MSKTHWVMFIFGFLLDKINLFPFILGLFLGIYLINMTLRTKFNCREIFMDIYDRHHERLQNQKNEPTT